MRIGELAKITKTKTETIRFYEKEGLLPQAVRTASNYRSYGAEHGQRLSFIRRARDLGFRLDDARGPGGQPPPGKDSEPSAPRGPKQRAAPGAARRRQSTPNSAALDLAGRIPDVQPL